MMAGKAQPVGDPEYSHMLRVMTDENVRFSEVLMAERAELQEERLGGFCLTSLNINMIPTSYRKGMPQDEVYRNLARLNFLSLLPEVFMSAEVSRKLYAAQVAIRPLIEPKYRGLANIFRKRSYHHIRRNEKVRTPEEKKASFARFAEEFFAVGRD